MTAYVRPVIEEQVFRDASGDVIDLRQPVGDGRAA